MSVGSNPAGVYIERKLGRRLSVPAARVAQGYRTLDWFGIVLFVAPAFTIGVWRLYGSG